LAFCTGVFAVGKFGMDLGTETLRTLAFVVLVFGSQATIYAIRERRHLLGSSPSLLLAVSSIADIAIASTLAVSGIVMTPLPVLVVGGTLAAAAIFAFILDLVKVPVFARLGITQRHRPMTHETKSIAKTAGTPVTEPSAGQPNASNSKPDAKAEPKPETKMQPKLEAKPEPKPGAKAEAKTEAKAEAKPDAKSEAKTEAKPEAKTEPKPETKTESEPGAKADVATLLNTSLGELLVAGLIKDPEDAGRIIAAAIGQAGATIAAAKAPEVKVELKPEAMAEPKPEAAVEPKPEAKAESQPDAKAKTPSASTPQTTK
jgi:hypothetical protein